MRIHQQIISAVLALAAVLLAHNSCWAQAGGIYTNPYNPRPTVSPYLNLLQGGANSLNLPQYQTLVRPFLDQQSINERNQFDTQSLKRQVNTLQGQVNRATIGPGRATGHPTRYMNYSHYYSLGR